jgi:dTDP-4-dehydrorhamnose 3,5-epimerase
MKVTKYEIDGILLFDLDYYTDGRGLFLETYQKERYKGFGIKEDFIQDNRSISGKDVLRGLHYQILKPIGQLIYVAQGSIFDVGVDLRKSSPTFGMHLSFELDAKDHKQLYLPPGIAHGFCTLSEINEIHYKCTEYYCPEDEGGINWKDQDLSIDWPLKNPIIKERDASFPMLNEVATSRLPR